MIPKGYLAAGAIAASLLVGLTTGWTVNGWRYEAAIAQGDAALKLAQDKAWAHERSIIKHRADAVRLAQELEVERNREAQVIEVEVERETVVYLESDSAGDCGVDVAGVRLINKSASGFRVREGRAGTAAAAAAMHCPGPAARATGDIWRTGDMGHANQCPLSRLRQPAARTAGLGAVSSFG